METYKLSLASSFLTIQINQVAQSIERQERNIDRLAALFEQQSQQELETVQRLEQIVESLLDRK